MFVCMSRIDSKTMDRLDSMDWSLILILCRMVLKKIGKNKKVGNVRPLLNLNGLHHLLNRCLVNHCAKAR